MAAAIFRSTNPDEHEWWGFQKFVERIFGRDAQLTATERDSNSTLVTLVVCVGKQVKRITV